MKIALIIVSGVLALVLILGVLVVADANSKLETTDLLLWGSQAEVDRLMTVVVELKGDAIDLEADLFEATWSIGELENNLDEISDVYPLGEFNDASELQVWIAANAMPFSLSMNEQYRSALTIQHRAMLDGYTISVDLDVYDDNSIGVSLMTCISGQLYYWFISSGEAHEFFDVGTGYETT